MLYQVLGCLQGVVVVGIRKQLPQRWDNPSKKGVSQWNWVGYGCRTIKKNAHNSLSTCS